jgi:hypothetical protein
VIASLSFCGGIVDSNDANSSGYMDPVKVLTKNIWAQLSSDNDGWRIPEFKEHWDNGFMFSIAANDSLLIRYLELEVYNAKDSLDSLAEPLEDDEIDDLIENGIFIELDSVYYLDSTDCDTVHNLTDSTFQSDGFYNDISPTIKYFIVWDTLKIMSIRWSNNKNELDTIYSMWIRLEDCNIKTYNEDSLQQSIITEE